MICTMIRFHNCFPENLFTLTGCQSNTVYQASKNEPIVFSSVDSLLGIKGEETSSWCRKERQLSGQCCPNWDFDLDSMLHFYRLGEDWGKLNRKFIFPLWCTTPVCTAVTPFFYPHLLLLSQKVFQSLGRCAPFHSFPSRNIKVLIAILYQVDNFVHNTIAGLPSCLKYVT